MNYLKFANYCYNLSDKLKGNHIHSNTNIPLPVVSSRKTPSPIAHTGCNFSKNPGYNSDDPSSKHNPLRKYSNVDIEGMKARPHSLGVDTAPGVTKVINKKRPSYVGDSQPSIEKELGNGTKAQKSFSDTSTFSPSAIDGGKTNSQFASSKRGEGFSDVNSKRPDQVVKTTKLEKVPSKSIDNKSFQNTSSSESGSFNATNYKGERTYF